VCVCVSLLLLVVLMVVPALLLLLMLLLVLMVVVLLLLLQQLLPQLLPLSLPLPAAAAAAAGAANCPLPAQRPSRILVSLHQPDVPLQWLPVRKAATARCRSVPLCHYPPPCSGGGAAGAQKKSAGAGGGWPAPRVTSVTDQDGEGARADGGHGSGVCALCGEGGLWYLSQ